MVCMDDKEKSGFQLALEDMVANQEDMVTNQSEQVLYILSQPEDDFDSKIRSIVDILRGGSK